MQNELKNYRTNLFVIFTCLVITTLFNTHLFTSRSVLHLLYGIAMVVLSGLTLYSLILINKNITFSTKIATIIGPAMALLAFIEGFIINFRVTCLFIMVGGILLFNSGRKVNKNNL